MGIITQKNDVNTYIDKFILKPRISNKEIRFLCFIAACVSSKKHSKLTETFEIAKNHKISTKKIYETIIQIYLFCGFPATIESLKHFNIVFPEFKKKHKEFDLNQSINIGQKNCREIYRSNYDKLLDNFYSLSPDLKDWMIIEGYGKVMGRTGLSLKERELINVTVLSTNYYEHQLYSHIKGAINTGSEICIIESIIKQTSIFNKSSNVRRSLKILNSIRNLV
jgi:alkylhydroperoxidase/carboxymuconolactone decarboxylase family protein YurZ